MGIRAENQAKKYEVVDNISLILDSHQVQLLGSKNLETAAEFLALPDTRRETLVAIIA